MSEARAEYESAIDKSYAEFRERVATAYQVMADAADKAWYDYQVSIEHERKVAAENAEGHNRSDSAEASGPERESSVEPGQPPAGPDSAASGGLGTEVSQEAGAAVSGTLPDSRVDT